MSAFAAVFSRPARFLPGGVVPETLLESLPARLTSVTYTTSALGGFREATLVYEGEYNSLQFAYNYLGKKVKLVRNGVICWEGLVTALEFSNGVRYSLDDYVNAVIVEYSDMVGNRAVTDWAIDEGEVARFGLHEKVISFDGATLEAAERLRDLHLYFGLRKLAQDELEVPARPSGRHVTMELRAVGFYAALAWEYWTCLEEGDVDTGTQIYNILGGRTPYSNCYIARSAIGQTGVSCSQYRPELYFTCQQEIERLLKFQDAGGEPLWFQVWEGQIGRVVRWGGGDFPNADYYDNGRAILDTCGNEVPPWLVRADKVLISGARLPAVAFGAGVNPLDEPTGFYILETSYSYPPDGLKFERVQALPLGWEEMTSLVPYFGFP